MKMGCFCPCSAYIRCFFSNCTKKKTSIYLSLGLTPARISLLSAHGFYGNIITTIDSILFDDFIWLCSLKWSFATQEFEYCADR